MKSRTLSTRVNEDENRILEIVAQLRGVTISRLIAEAAVTECRRTLAALGNQTDVRPSR